MYWRDPHQEPQPGKPHKRSDPLQLLIAVLGFMAIVLLFMIFACSFVVHGR